MAGNQRKVGLRKKEKEENIVNIRLCKDRELRISSGFILGSHFSRSG